MKFKQDDWVYYRGRKAIVNQTMIGAYNKPLYKVYIDSRWEEDVIKTIKGYDSNAKDNDIKEVLKLVIYEG